METAARSVIFREARALRIAFLAVMLGFAVMVGIFAYLGPFSQHQSDRNTVAILHFPTGPQHDCLPSSGSIASHCHSPSAFPGDGLEHLDGPTRAFGDRWTLPDRSSRTQHRPRGLLRPPNTPSRSA